MKKNSIKTYLNNLKNPGSFFEIPSLIKIELEKSDKKDIDCNLTIYLEKNNEDPIVLKFNAIIIPDFRLKKAFSKIYKKSSPLLIGFNFSKNAQRRLIENKISFLDLKFGNVFLISDNPLIYVLNCFKNKEIKLDFNYHNYFLFQDEVTIFYRELLDKNVNMSLKSGEEIAKLFKDKSSNVLRNYLNSNKKLSNKDIYENIDNISKSLITKVNNILINNYNLTPYKNQNSKTEYRLLNAIQLLNDWIDFYSHIKIDYRVYKINYDKFLEQINTQSFFSDKAIFFSFSFKPFIGNHIRHVVLNPKNFKDLNWFEFLLNLEPTTPDDEYNFIVSMPVYEKSFSFGSYKVQIPRTNFKIWVLSQVQQLLDLSRLLPEAEEEINKRIQEISNGFERKFYPSP